MPRPSFGASLALALVGALVASAGLAAAWRAEDAKALHRPLRVHHQVQGIHKIRHVIVIMQENRSFDSYFGTFPGADGIPMRDGVPKVCVADTRGGCQRPYHDPFNLNRGGPHSESNAIRDIAGGKMNGFVEQAEAAQRCRRPDAPWCRAHGRVDVMGYHDAREIPNYWAYARNYVLQDHMFEPNASWSLPAHLFIVSEWSARCTSADPFSCVNELQRPGLPPDFTRTPHRPFYSWTDLTYLLHEHHVSWRYYVARGTQPDCADDGMTCRGVLQSARTPGIWNPLPYFETVKRDHQLRNITPLGQYFAAARNGALPAVSWIVPNGRVSEHPPALVSTGEKYVTRLIDAAMRGPDWDSTAIFLAWDDWGGFYDHVVPPRVDENG
jgi:phospholipase C